jgi:hypothetical protein
VQFFTENTTLIIPTRNRPIQIVSLLKQIKLFKVEFFEILVIDSSDLVNKKFLKEEGRKFDIIADPNNVRVLRYDFINDETKSKAIRNKANVDVSHKKISTDLELKAFRASPMSYNDKKLLLNAWE